MRRTPAASSEEEATIKYVCGIDIGSQSCAGCMCRPDKSVVIKAITFANAREGWQIWEEKLNQLDAPPGQMLIGMEATSRYGENLYHELEQRGYVLRLLHPGQTHHFHQQRSLRAKTDRLDAMTIARARFRGEARMGYVPGEQVATYRELVRLHTQLSDTAAGYQNEIQALIVVLSLTLCESSSIRSFPVRSRGLKPQPIFSTLLPFSYPKVCKTPLSGQFFLLHGREPWHRNLWIGPPVSVSPQLHRRFYVIGGSHSPGRPAFRYEAGEAVRMQTKRG